MTKDEAIELINQNEHLINTTPENFRIEYIYYTPSNGENHEEIKEALYRDLPYEHLIEGYDDYTVNVLYTDDRNIAPEFFENLEVLLERINSNE